MVVSIIYVLFFQQWFTHRRSFIRKWMFQNLSSLALTASSHKSSMPGLYPFLPPLPLTTKSTLFDPFVTGWPADYASHNAPGGHLAQVDKDPQNTSTGPLLPANGPSSTWVPSPATSHAGSVNTTTPGGYVWTQNKKAFDTSVTFLRLCKRSCVFPLSSGIGKRSDIVRTLPNIHLHGPVSISNKTSYCKTSQSLEGARFVFRIVRSLWNLAVTSAALLVVLVKFQSDAMI